MHTDISDKCLCTSFQMGCTATGYVIMQSSRTKFLLTHGWRLKGPLKINMDGKTERKTQDRKGKKTCSRRKENNCSFHFLIHMHCDKQVVFLFCFLLWQVCSSFPDSRWKELNWMMCDPPTYNWRMWLVLVQAVKANSKATVQFGHSTSLWTPITYLVDTFHEEAAINWRSAVPSDVKLRLTVEYATN